jgi:nitrous oxidase accessory protein NosD
MKTFIPALAFLAFTLSATAQAETTNCTAITTVPYTIATPGVYCLKSHLSTSITQGSAIEIHADNVVLDLNGNLLDGSGAGLGTMTAGITSFMRSNITVRNGTVRGFFSGVAIDDRSPYTVSRGNVIEDIRAVRNTFKGIAIAGTSVVRNNQVLETGGSTIASIFPAYGIVISGPGARALNNDVMGVTPTGNDRAVGILMHNAPRSVAAGNRISDTIVSASGAPGYGIVTSWGNDVTLKDNIIANSKFGIFFENGSTGKYMNNMTQGVATPYTGGTTAGTTNY